MRVLRKDGTSQGWLLKWQALVGVPSTLREPLCLAEGGGGLLYRIFGESLEPQLPMCSGVVVIIAPVAFLLKGPESQGRNSTQNSWRAQE